MGFFPLIQTEKRRRRSYTLEHTRVHKHTTRRRRVYATHWQPPSVVGKLLLLDIIWATHTHTFRRSLTRTPHDARTKLEHSRTRVECRILLAADATRYVKHTQARTDTRTNYRTTAGRFTMTQLNSETAASLWRRWWRRGNDVTRNRRQAPQRVASTMAAAAAKAVGRCSRCHNHSLAQPFWWGRRVSYCASDARRTHSIAEVGVVWVFHSIAVRSPQRALHTHVDC